MSERILNATTHNLTTLEGRPSEMYKKHLDKESLVPNPLSTVCYMALGSSFSCAGCTSCSEVPQVYISTPTGQLAASYTTVMNFGIWVPIFFPMWFLKLTNIHTDTWGTEATLNSQENFKNNVMTHHFPIQDAFFNVQSYSSFFFLSFILFI